MLKRLYLITVATILSVTLLCSPVFAEDVMVQEEAIPQKDSLQAEVLEEQLEEEMDFLFIESAELQTPGVQNIAVSWSESIAGADDLRIVLADPDGNHIEFPEYERTEESVRFQINFEGPADGTYKVLGMAYSLDGQDGYLEFGDMDMKPEFKAIPVSEDTGEALEAVVGAVPQQITGRDVVVVLDPGHGGSEKGAAYAGIEERVINYKIATACKAELETYDGVKVYLTRGANETISLYDRVKKAAKYNPDVLISMHNNAKATPQTPMQNGCEVWYPNTSGKAAYHETGKDLSNSILAELSKLGITNRGAKTRTNTSNSADYYGIIRYSKERGFPGIIIEHAFLDNPDDRNAYLSTDAALKKLGVSDATGIANYYMLSRAYINEEGIICDKHGQAVLNSWVIVNKKYYHTDEAGYPLTGFQVIDGKRYYLGESGAASKGWLETEEGKYYRQDAKGLLAINKVVTVSGSRYGFDEEGFMYAGCNVKFGDYRYTFLANGKAILYKAKTKKKVTLRKGPGTGYAKAGKLGRNKAFTVVRTSGKWSQLTDGRWIQTKYRKKVVNHPVFVPYKVQTTKSGYYRANAGTKYRSKGAYAPGVNLTVLQRNSAGTWGRVAKNKWVYLPYTQRVIENSTQE